MLEKLYCKLTGRHRFHGAPEIFIDKYEMVNHRHICIRCGKTFEWVDPWIRVDFSKEDK